MYTQRDRYTLTHLHTPITGEQNAFCKMSPIVFSTWIRVKTFLVPQNFSLSPPSPFSFHVFLWVWGVCWGSGHTRQALSDWAMSQCSESGFYYHGFISLFSNFTQTAFPSAGTCGISPGTVVSTAHGVSEFWLLQTRLWWPHVDTPVVYVDRNRHEQTEVTQVHVGLSCPGRACGPQMLHVLANSWFCPSS